jgi:hypothetical protein
VKRTLKQRCQTAGINRKESCGVRNSYNSETLVLKTVKGHLVTKSRYKSLHHCSSDWRNISRGSQTVPGNVSIKPTPLDSCAPAGLPA